MNSGKAIDGYVFVHDSEISVGSTDRAVECNENIMLKCLGFGEPPCKTLPLVGAEGD